MEIKKLNHHLVILESIKVQIASLQKLIENLDPLQTEKAVHLILLSKGKVVLLGVGKSGIIAQKIAATMTSTGSPAIYLHASDAMHGDLGVIHKDDVIIALSNSGETEEILALLPHLQNRMVKIIAITGNINSTLASSADAVLNSFVDKEACTLNLAPTTSTTVALAVGDALSVALMDAKNITEKDFAINHPAGKLGKRLSIKVKNLMNYGVNNPIINLDSSWNEILETIERSKLGAVNIIDKDKKLLGIITDGDIRRAIKKYESENIKELKAGDIMTQNPVTVQPEMLAYSALQLMEKGKSQIAVLPVIDENNICVGLIRIHDIIGKL